MKIDAKNKEKTILLFTSLILLSFILIGLDKLGWLNWLKRPVEKLTNPVREKIYKQVSKKKVTNHYNKLEVENADLKVKLENLEQENVAMKRLLGAPLSPAWKFIPAKVINVKNGIMTVNQGSDAGIKQEEIAVFENVLIGQIIKVNPNLSKIKLVIHKDVNIKAKIAGSTVRGKGVVRLEAGAMFLDEVLQEVNLEKGQIVTTSAEDEIYPADLLIGKIDSIEKNETAIYKKAMLKPFLNYQTLDTVFVVKN